MKVGDLVQIKEHGPTTAGGDVWHEFMGKIGIIVGIGKRLHIPAFKVMLLGEVVEFDHDEVEVFLNEAS